MTLWNLIRDFFVKNIFGGLLSDGETFVDGCFIGLGYHNQNLDGAPITTSSMMVNIGNYNDFTADIPLNSLSLGDWLSTTFTIITLVLLVIFLYIFVKWIFKLFAGLLH